MDIRRRRALQLSVGSAIAAALSFPFSLAHAANQPPKVALVMKSLANEFFLATENGAYKHQKDHASKCSLLTNSIRDETNTANQIRLIEQMIITRVGVLVLAPIDSKALVPVVRKAVDAGTLIVSIDNRLDPAALKEEELNAPFVGPDSRKGARLVGDFVTESLKPGSAVGVIKGIPTATSAQQRIVGLKDAAEAAELKIVEVQSGEWEIGKGSKMAAAMLCSKSNLKVLLYGNDNVAIGAASTVRMTGGLGKVLIGGYDNTDAVKATLADGRVVVAAGQHADRQAIYGIETALKTLASKMPRAKLSGVVETPVSLVTRP